MLAVTCRVFEIVCEANQLCDKQISKWCACAADLDSRSRSTCPQGSSMGRTGRQWEPCLRLAECNAGIRWNYVSEWKENDECSSLADDIIRLWWRES